MPAAGYPASALEFPLSAFRFFFALLLLAAPSVQAATTVNWTGNTSTAWGTASNWSSAPTNDLLTSIANFNLATYGGNPVFSPNAGTTSINGITIGSSNGVMTLASSNLSIGNGGITIANGAGALTVGPVTTGAAQSWTNNDNDAATFGVIALTNKLTLAGGDFIFGGTNTGSGGIDLNAGNLIAKVAAGFGPNTNTLKFGGGNLELRAATTTFVGKIDLSAAGETITINPATAGSGVTHTISGAATFGTQTTVMSAGTLTTTNTAYGLTLSGAKTFSAADSNSTFTINGNGSGIGTLSLITGTIDTGGTSHTLTFNNGTGSGANKAVLSGAFTGTAGTLILAGSAPVTVGALTTSANAIQVNSTTGGVYTFNGASTYTGGTTLTAGTLNINSAGVASTSGPLGNGGTFAINGGTIDNTSGAAIIVLNVNPIALGGNFAFSTAGGTTNNNLTLPGAVTLGANRTITANGGGTLTLSGVIGGVGYSLTKAGTGTLAISGANTYTGATTINDGTLSIGDATTFNNTSNIILASGGRLDVNVANQTLAKLATSGGGSGVVAGSFLRYSQAQTTGTTGPGTISGTVELNITNANPNYTLDFGDGGKLTNVSAGTVAYTSGITLSGNATIDCAAQRFDGTGMTVSASTAGAKTLTLTGSYINPTTSNINGVISNGIGTLNLEKTGVGSWNLSAINTFTGSVTVADGTLKLGIAGALNAANVVTVGGSGTTPILDVNQSNTIAGLNGGGFTNGTVTNTSLTARTLTLGGSGTYSYGGNITATTPANLALTKSGTGIQNLGGTNTYAGNTLVSAGTLQFAKQISLYNNGAAAAWSNTNINVNSGATMAFNIGGTGEFTKANIITLLGLSTGANGFKTGSIVGLDTTSADFLYDSVIANTNNGTNVLGLTKLGANKLTLSQANTYTGNTTVTTGTLQLGNGGTTGSLATTSTITNNGTLAFNRSDTITQGTNFSSAIGGTGTLVQNGSGTLKLLQNNTYTGGTTINAGTIQLNGGTALGNSTSTWLTFGGNSTLQFFGAADLLATRTIAINPNVTATIDTNGFNSSQAAVISGNGTLAKTGAGTFALTNSSNSYTGGTRINQGALSVATGSNLGTAPGSPVANSIEFTGNSTLQMTGNFSFNANRGITVDSGVTGTMEVTGSNEVTAAQIISGAGTLGKTGTGTLVLSGNNTYTGPTNVTGGSLLVNGNQTSATGAVTVASGATLGGNGTVGGATTIQSGGILAPGNSPGVETFASGLTLQTGSAFTFELDANTADLANRGTNFDGVNVTGGTLAVESGVNFNAIFNLAGSTVNFTADFWKNSHSWLVFENASAPTTGSPVFNLGTVSTDSFGNSLSGNLSFSQTGNDIYLDFSFMPPVPEPSTWVAMTALILTGGFMGLRPRW